MNTKDRALGAAMPLPPQAFAASERNRSRWAWPSAALFILGLSLALWTLILGLIDMLI